MDKIICVGKNYLKHAQELGDAVPEEPVYFLKPPSTIFEACTGNDQLKIPTAGEVHHELELVFKISTKPLAFTHYTLGLDLTLRDLQSRLKKAGQPWEKSKVFMSSAVLGPWQPLTDLQALLDSPFELKVNGETRQLGYGRDMRWKPLEILNDVERWFPVCDGDLLYSGTPEGVGPLKTGDRLNIRGPGVDYRLTCV